MDDYYDSSAFAKLFLREAGSDQMKQQYEQAASRTVSRLAFLEGRSAIERLERDGNITPADATRARTRSAAEPQFAHITPVDEDVLNLAQDLIGRRELRTLDAIQLASAMLARKDRPVRFVLSDRRLTAAAVAEGFQVWDPSQP